MRPSELRFLRNIEIETSEILLIESDINYSHLWLQSGQKITIAKTLKQITEIVKEAPFVRVNRQTILNVAHIRGYKSLYPVPEAEMTDGKKVIFSRRRAQQALFRINQIIDNQF